LLRKSNTKCKKAELIGYMAAEGRRNHDLWQITNGHDVAALFGIALRKLIGTRRQVHTWASEIEAGLRLAFDWEALIGTKLYADLKNWEVNNSPHRIFRSMPVIGT
jgi:hypothetical protein